MFSPPSSPMPWPALLPLLAFAKASASEGDALILDRTRRQVSRKSLKKILDRQSISSTGLEQLWALSGLATIRI